MRYPPEFFALVFNFAGHASRIFSQPFEDTLLTHTPLYPALCLGIDFDPENQAWRQLCYTLQNSLNPIHVIYTYYSEQQVMVPAPEPSPFGCFSYAVWDDGRIRIHFQNEDPGGSLRHERRAARIAELTALFRDVQAKVAHPNTVVGGSWLYNVEAYRRLFPPAYLKTAQVGEPEYQFVALWGQFLTGHGKLRKETATAFLERCVAAQNPAELQMCFPFQVLRLEASIEHFYSWYSIAQHQV